MQTNCSNIKRGKQMPIKDQRWGKIVIDEELKDKLLNIAIKENLIDSIDKESIVYNLIETNDYYIIEIIPKQPSGGNKKLTIIKRDFYKMRIDTLHL